MHRLNVFFLFSSVVAEETPPPSELLCLDVLHKSTDDGAVITLTTCALGDDAAAEDGAFDEQKWEFSEVILVQQQECLWRFWYSICCLVAFVPISIRQWEWWR